MQLLEPGDARDLASIMERRERSIREAGGDPASPPAWAFIGHPLARGAIALLADDPSHFRPLEPVKRRGMRLVATVHGLRLGHIGIRLLHEGHSVTIDAGNCMARIRLKGVWPDTVVDTLPGRPLHDILALPGVTAGTPAGDSRIRDSWQDDGALGFTVSCTYVPLADAPIGTDTSWLEEWEQRHAQ